MSILEILHSKQSDANKIAALIEALSKKQIVNLSGAKLKDADMIILCAALKQKQTVAYL